ncbi:MAG: GTP-binding protein [Kosmotoga sp.]|nr:MAG: GTP-binding protein [Kosmotoga sp.]
MKRLYIITGFLGAGKTTFLNNAIALVNKKIDVVINEFGKVGFDSRQLKANRINIFEINGGSIYCSCREKEFYETMVEIAETDAEFVFIESSGLSDPSNIKPVISRVIQKTKGEMKIEAVVTLVDALRFVKLNDMFPVIKKQIEAASTIIVNKTDMVSAENLDKIVNVLRRHNNKASLIKTVHGKIEDISTISGKVKKLNGVTLNKPTLREKSILIESKCDFQLRDVRKYLEDISGELLRVKGTFSTSEKSYYADCVEKQISISETDDIKKGLRLIVIAPRNKPVVSYIKNQWLKYFNCALNFK